MRMTSKGYVIEIYNDFLEEIMFLGKDEHWTPFLTEAKTFSSKEEAKEYWENCKTPAISPEIICRFY